MVPIPEVGEHNEKILAELGYEDVETRAPGRDAGDSSEIHRQFIATCLD